MEFGHEKLWVIEIVQDVDDVGASVQRYTQIWVNQSDDLRIGREVLIVMGSVGP